LDWLYRYDFDTLTLIAVWCLAGVLVTTVVLFFYAIGLRTATLIRNRRRGAFIRRWREVFAMAVINHDAAAALPLPVVHRHDETDLLEEWNRVRSLVDGKAIDNLIVLARRTAIRKIAVRKLHHGRLSSRILAVHTLGHLRDEGFRDEFLELVDHPHTVLSITAAEALIEIDPALAGSTIVPMLARRRDWPRDRVSVLLRRAGSERISEPVYRAIRSATDADKAYLLQFTRLVEPEVLDALVSDLLRENNDPAVLNAALKLVNGFSGVPRIAALLRHDVWFVRMQAAKVLGRVGQQEHLSLLLELVSDPEWWVRYRAAQSIASLPFLGPNRLRQIRAEQADPYASDILGQAYAEVGIA